MKTRNSQFISSVKLAFVEQTDEVYDKLKQHFENHGDAFLINKVIFFDVNTLKRKKQFTKAHRDFIESHEVAHIVLKHQSLVRDKKQEAEADYIGIQLCIDKNLNKSAELGINSFQSRNNIPYNKYNKNHGIRLKNKVLSQ
tara:strand:+ start:288 stop:710 length:423 start_codon:yes stop_codon:yes gene_type:complete